MTGLVPRQKSFNLHQLLRQGPRITELRKTVIEDKVATHSSRSYFQPKYRQAMLHHVVNFVPIVTSIIKQC